MTTTVAHRKKCKGSVPIDRSTIFGNPFVIGRDGDRSGVLEKFEEYFIDRLASDTGYRSAVLGLRGKVLGCWCHPEPCHGDIIAEYLNAPVAT